MTYSPGCDEFFVDDAVDRAAQLTIVEVNLLLADLRFDLRGVLSQAVDFGAQRVDVAEFGLGVRQRGVGGGELGGRRAFVVLGLAKLRLTLVPKLARDDAADHCVGPREVALRLVEAGGGRSLVGFDRLAARLGGRDCVWSGGLGHTQLGRRALLLQAHRFQLGAQLGETKRSLALVDHHQDSPLWIFSPSVTGRAVTQPSTRLLMVIMSARMRASFSVT